MVIIRLCPMNENKCSKTMIYISDGSFWMITISIIQISIIIQINSEQKC